MSWGVEEGDGAAVYLNGVSADMLRDAAGLTGNDVRVADIVKQRGLAVVNVTHDNDNRCSRHQILRLILMVVDKTLLNRNYDFLLDLAAKLHGDERRGVIVDNIGNGGEHAELEELLYDLGRGLLHTGGQFADGNFVGYLDLELLLLRYLKLKLLHTVSLFLTALGRGGLLVLALLGLADNLFLGAKAHIAGTGLAAGHILKLLVIFLNIHSRAAAGINNALLSNLARSVRLIGLLGLFGLLRSRLLRLLRGCSGRLSRLFLSRCRRLFRCGFLLCRGSGLLRHLEDILKGRGLVMLGHILEDNVKLMILQHLHMVLRRRNIISQDLADHLGRHIKILCNFMHSILNHAHTLFLLFPILLFFSCAAASFLRRSTLSNRRWISAVLSS